MSDQPRRYPRVIGLTASVLLMVAVVVGVGERLRSPGHDSVHSARVDHASAGSPLDMIRSETAMYNRRAMSVPVDRSLDAAGSERNLAAYYDRRAYSGAPPQIPHEVSDELARSQDCNTCHQGGGFVEKYNAYTPVTPHPEYKNCMQCHVEKNADDQFAESLWASIAPPALHRPMLPGGPPPIPHTLQLREDCMRCHAGPAAPLEIRTTHPERVNCRQCHVPSTPGLVFNREAGLAAAESK